MILYLDAKTSDNKLYIDFIEVKLTTGETVSLNWDESWISRSQSGFSAKYKGVYFGEEYANGKIDELKDMEIVHVELYSHSEEEYPEDDFSILSMTFQDGEKELTFDTPALPKSDEVIQSNEPWYIERWYDEDLIQVFRELSIPVTQESLAKARTACKTLFYDKSERFEMINNCLSSAFKH